MTLPEVSAGTRVLAVLGDPVRHSLSPLIQNAAIRAAGLDGIYVALRCDDAGFDGVMRGLCRAGGGGNVTLPHKRRAAALLDVSSDAVRGTGACNTFWQVDGRVHGDNTDVEGFRRALGVLLGESAKGRRALVLGAGGAARAVVVALLADGVRELTILNRTTEKAREIASDLASERIHVAEDRTRVEGGSYDLVVNATRLGLHESDPLPIELERLSDVSAVMDVVYGSARTPLVRAAAAMGVPAADGGEMLVQQGAVAFERWWGVPAPVEVMRGTLEGARAR
jgi:shikimate dehydrogenase